VNSGFTGQPGAFLGFALFAFSGFALLFFAKAMGHAAD
jgi:hypothetical protein